MARVISYTIIAKDKFSNVADKISRKTDHLTNRMRMLAVGVQVASGAFNGLGQQVKKLGRWMSVGSVAVTGVGTKAVLVAGKMEVLRTSIEAVAGSASKGKIIMENLLDFAAKTPFEIAGLGETTKKLQVMGIETENLIPKLRILGDIASISGGDVPGLALIYSKIRGREKWSKRTMYQLIHRNIPIVDAVATLMNKKAGADVITPAMVRNNSEKIPGLFVIEALETLNKKGNVAYKAMEKLSATTPGLWSNVADEMTQTWEVLGLIVSDFINVKGWLSDIIDVLGATRSFLQTMAKDWPFLTGLLGTIIMFFTLLGPILAVFGGFIVHMVVLSAAIAALKYYTGGTVVVMGAFKSILWAINTALGINLALIGWWALGIMLVVVAVILLWQYWEKFTNFLIQSIFQVMMWFGKLSDKASNMWGGVTKFFGSIFSENKSSVAVQLDVNDPGNNLSSVSATTSGPVFLNTGANLMGVR